MDVACERKRDARACGLLADELMTGVFVEADIARATKLRERACEASQIDACDRLAEQYLEGVGVAPDRRTAVRYLAIACKAGRARACWEIAGQTDDDTQDLFQRAYSLASAACNGGDDRGCTDALEFAGAAHHADDEPELWIQLRANFENGCQDGDGAACLRFAEATHVGFAGAAADPARAQELRELSCELGDATGCEAAARWVLSDKDKDLALHEHGCKLGSATSCSYLGYLYLKEPARSRSAYQRACDLGDLNGCDHVVGAGERSCKLGSGAYCAQLAEEAEKGQDIKRAIALFARACDLKQIWDGCGNELRLLHGSCVAGTRASCTTLDARRALLEREVRDVVDYACCRDRDAPPTTPTAAILALRDAISERNVDAIAALVHPKHGLSIDVGWVDTSGRHAQELTTWPNAIDLDKLSGAMMFAADRVSCEDVAAGKATCRSFEGGFQGAYVVEIY
ncbi:MAG TPA: tetratricopeptide repeat protein, partial [Kofleriaceae bacterium]|nr:tetratricopeptide repeat protein [Kofleriaceae bacterium]